MAHPDDSPTAYAELVQITHTEQGERAEKNSANSSSRRATHRLPARLATASGHC